jgi:hypothetical protein
MCTTRTRRSRHNLDALIERVKRIAPTHVYLQAFADPDGNNTADALYFPTGTCRCGRTCSAASPGS